MSQLENCPTCENPTSPNAETCPKCGEPLGTGWANTIIEAREAEAKAREAEAKAREEEAEHRRHAKAKVEAEEKLRKKKRRRIIWASVAATILFVFWLGGADERRFDRLKAENPEEYQRIIAEQIEEIEKKVAAVPASDYAKNIGLYQKLLNLDPGNERYIDKINYYEAAQKNTAAAARARKTAAEQAKKAEERRKGFHCLSGWDGSHASFKRYVEKQMRDPDSFEHIETRITPVNEKGHHVLFMEYRARNGFGGMTAGTATATVRSSDCKASAISID